MFDMQLVTVWSAPNYCYRCGNKASILTIHEDGEQSFTVYGAAEENERDKGMQTRRMVSHQVFFQIVNSHLKVLALEQHAVFRLKNILLSAFPTSSYKEILLLGFIRRSCLKRSGFLRGCDGVCR
jgi:hypothetical protein